jgi:hypothetical protein
MREQALQMRKLTLNMMVWSAVSIGDGDELDFAITGEVLRKGMTKFVQLRAPLDVCLLPDDLCAEAHLLDLAPETGVACTVEFVLDSGDSIMMMARIWKN